MRTIIHLSDIHFGKIDRTTIEPLVRAVHEAQPDLVIVSGDLTQRALRKEFRAARDFLHSLPGPQIIVPGNHDIPIWNPIERFSRPLARFKHFITANLHPIYEDEEIAAVGLNTARSRSTKYGHINRAQLSFVREKLCPIPNDRIKILVTHHPFDLPEGYSDKRQLVNRAGRAMKVLAECGVDLLLAGHLHRIFARDTAERYKIRDYAALVVQAGTATGWRSAREANSFNIIECLGKSISVARMSWNGSAFERSAEDRFEHSENGWSRPHS
ncbi:MAG TPA: metallophosphoesterase family protein [Candidatus Kapabacteria bacterium]|nr:metallophosphoesterase family protein [Candidatus Kapabacteria bacterium]